VATSRIPGKARRPWWRLSIGASTLAGSDLAQYERSFKLKRTKAGRKRVKWRNR
jgi:hypothetical protein